MILPSRELMPVIRAALDRGQRVRMTVSGASMLPIIHSNDVVELEPAPALRLGDVALVQTNPPGQIERYVIHRLVRLERDGTVLVRGDAQRESEGPFAANAVLGRVTTAWHNGRPRSLERGWWRLVGLAWLRCAPLGFWLLWLTGLPWRLASRLARRLQRSSSFRAWVKRFQPAFSIREAKESDLLALGTGPHPPGQPTVPVPAPSANPHLTTYVAACGEQVLGSVRLMRHPETDSVHAGYWLYSLTVRTRYRGMGIGAALTQRVVEQSRSEGATELFLDVSEDNPPAIALYRKLGFEPVTLPAIVAEQSADTQTQGRRRAPLRKRLV